MGLDKQLPDCRLLDKWPLGVLVINFLQSELKGPQGNFI